MTAANNWDPSLYQDKHAFVYEFGRDLLGLLAPKPGERILDVGCGTGQLTRAIAEVGALVIGLDNSAQMIETARNNYPDIQFVIADAADFSLPATEPFDAVFSNAALHWVTRADEAARCIARALRPGGRFVAEFGGRDNGGNITLAIRETLVDKLNLSVSHPWYFPTIGEYATVLESHGLAVGGAWLFDRPTPLEGEDGMRNWMAMFCQSMFRDVPAGRIDEILGEIEERLRGTNYRDGAWFVDYRRLRITALRKS